jgi:hypothetical protein
VVLVGQETPVEGFGRYRFTPPGHLLGRGIEPCALLQAPGSMVISAGNECGHWDYAVHVGCDLLSDDYVLLLGGLTYDIPFGLALMAGIVQRNGKSSWPVQSSIIILFHYLSSVKLSNIYFMTTDISSFCKS